MNTGGVALGIHGVQKLPGPRHIHLEEGLFPAGFDGACHMHHPVAAVHQTMQRIHIVQITDNPVHAVHRYAGAAGQGGDPISLMQQMTQNMAADKTGRAGQSDPAAR